MMKKRGKLVHPMFVARYNGNVLFRIRYSPSDLAMGIKWEDKNKLPIYGKEKPVKWW